MKLHHLLFGWTTLCLMTGSVVHGQGDDRLVGIWTEDQGFQIVDITFRANGRYELHTKSTDPVLDFESSERGDYSVQGQTLMLTPYDHLGEPQGKDFEFDLSAGALTLNRVEFQIVETYQFKTGSREEVLANEIPNPDLAGRWGRTITFAGMTEYTFRPGGYYVIKNTPEGGEFEPEFIRGRYQLDGNQLTVKPYSGVEVRYELDFFGNTLTMIRRDELFGESATFDLAPGSPGEVRAKAAEAEAFLNQPNWQVGTWEIRTSLQTVDLTLRPDGYYIAKEETEFLKGIVRGRYVLGTRRIQLLPFDGQGIYARSNGEFGKVERTRELDYYDGELQFVDLEAISQSVTIAHKQPGSDALVTAKVEQAQTERQREGWYLGIWEVNDPAGWMEFTFRPDQRYIAKSGTDRVPGQVERGQYVVTANKVTLAPYSGQGGSARGFDLDYYDGDWYLVGDLNRLVVARKIPGSEAEVIEKTRNPIALQGERGSILGLWTSNLPGQSSELVFREDGEFRLKRCASEATSFDYGLYDVDMASRTLLYDSRFVPVQTLGLDFYGDTLTLYGGLNAPSTYTVNLGQVDAAIAASHAADAQEAAVDAQWSARVPVGPRDPNTGQVPGGDLPVDPRPGLVFENATVLSNFQLYRRLIAGFVYFNEQGTIRSWPVVNTREWYFFPNGRALIRFKNYRAGVSYPNTVADITDNWAAYTVEPKPAARDILHIYADNVVLLQTDLGEQIELTLEDGRRNLFWEKDYEILSEWAAEQKTIPCENPANPNRSLANTGVDLRTSITPDPVELPTGTPLRLQLSGPSSGQVIITGTAAQAGNLVIERAGSLAAPVSWEPLRTNSITSGPFSFSAPSGTNAAAFFRIRIQ